MRTSILSPGNMCQSVIFGSLTLRDTRTLDFGVKFIFSKFRIEPFMLNFLAETENMCQSVIFGSLTLRKARALNFGVKFNFSKIRMEPVMHNFLAITENRKREIRTIE